MKWWDELTASLCTVWIGIGGLIGIVLWAVLR